MRARPATDAAIGQLAPGERVKVLSEEQGQAVGGNAAWYRVDGGRVAGARVHSSLIQRIDQPQPNVTAPSSRPSDRTWVVVDRKSSSLTLARDGQAAFVTYLSLGRAGASTHVGQHGTFRKLRADDMSTATVPDAQASYYLPKVLFTHYFREGGFAIHGAYRHDQFGIPQSQGSILAMRLPGGMVPAALSGRARGKGPRPERRCKVTCLSIFVTLPRAGTCSALTTRRSGMWTRSTTPI